MGQRIRKSLVFGIVLVMVAVVFAGVPMNVCAEGEYTSSFAGGTGTESDPYQISDVYELQKMNLDPNAHYILINDIDASDTVNWNSGAGFVQVGSYSNKFTGCLNGNGFEIIDLYINRPYDHYVGLFGFTSGSMIINVGLKNIDLTGYLGVGGLVGLNHGTILNSYATGALSGISYHAGGLVGYNYWGASLISDSYAACTVSGNYYYMGGLIGINSGTVSNSYATGKVSGRNYVGGLIGSNYGPISYCYSTGKVEGSSYTGGLIGYKSGVTVSNSYWDLEISGQTTSAGGIGKTTAQMKKQTTFVGWDFTNTWRIKEDILYPYLWWETHDPKEETKDLISLITTMDLPTGVENNLVSKLNDAIKLLEKENLNGAIHKLGDFKDYITAQRGKKLTDAQANLLIGYAQWIIDNIS